MRGYDMVEFLAPLRAATTSKAGRASWRAAAASRRIGRDLKVRAVDEHGP